MRTRKIAAGLVLAAAAAAVTPSAASVAAAVRPAAAATRTVTLSVPATASFGDNVTGYAAVSDVQGGSSNPVPGAQVQIEQLRGGSYVTVTRGQTDAGGVVSFSFTSRSNTIWRAVVRSSSGQTYSSRVRSTASVADVTWSGRPDDDVRHGTKVSYKVRVVPGQGATAAFQIATAARPNRWQTARRGTVPFTGVYSGSVVFPKAGTWRLRALSLPTGSNASGVSSTLTITVH